jgi:hypothetical protein
LLVATVFLLGGCGGAAHVPSAADRVPRLERLLKRLDADLVAHHYAAARADLQALKAAVAKARAAGQLDDAQAARVLDAVTQVMTVLPAATTTQSVGPGTPKATSSGPTGPTHSAKATPTRPRSTATTASSAPSVSPTGSPTPTASPTPTSSPTATTSATAQASPAAATSSPSP